MKKFIFTLCFMLMLTINVYANDWQERFAARLMRLMTSSPEYNVLVITDIDCNNIPEAFLIKKDGGIGHGITLKNGAVTALNVPADALGMCLTDITVYDTGAGYFCVGKMANNIGGIDYFKLSIVNNSLLCERALKADFSMYPSIAYTDSYSENLYTSGYPDRGKLNAFLGVYEAPDKFVVKPTNARLSIDGNNIDVSGFNIDDSNYYKIRDIAMVLRGTDSRFEVLWNADSGEIDIITKVIYTPVGGELYHKDNYREVKRVSSKLNVDGKGVILEGYNIDGNTYFKIRDIGELVGFETGWDASNQTILIIS